MAVLTRRNLLFGAASLVGGAAIFGYAGYNYLESASAERARDLVAKPNAHLLAGWVRLREDGAITVFIPHADMGQGVGTALAMQLAEEMDADWSMVGIEFAPADPAFANWFLALQYIREGRELPGAEQGLLDPIFRLAARSMNLQVTAGSTAVRLTGEFGFRTVGAVVRQMLLEAAAARLNAPATGLTVVASRVTDGSSGRSLHFGELAADAAHLRPASRPKLKAPSERFLTGTSPQRLDIPAKVYGSLRYGIDVSLPDMLYAAVRNAPVHGGALIDVDEAPALAMPGVERVVRTETALLVVARSWWQAEAAAAALAPRFSDGGNGEITTAQIEAANDAALENGERTQVQVVGEPENILARLPADRVVEAHYSSPYLHHATIEPINATARYADGRFEVWAGEQDAAGARADVATLTGLQLDDVVFYPCAIGGSFGRRVRPGRPQDSLHLVQVCAAAMALAPRPVKLIWSRVEDTRRGTYRPKTATVIRAGLGADGLPIAWSQVYTAGVVSREIAHPLPYAIPHQGYWSVPRSGHLRVGALRSVNATQHAYWRESMIDEVAERAGADPLAYRRALLQHDPRAVRLLDELSERAEWAAPLPAGRGRGMGFSAAFGTTLFAVAIEASAEDGRVNAHRAVAVVDCGTVIHPDTATAQMEGAIVQAISTALAEEITVANGAVEQSLLSDYGVMPLARSPEIAVHFLLSDAHAGGLGEAGFPAVTPALVNALARATGHRARRLPLEPFPQ